MKPENLYDFLLERLKEDSAAAQVAGEDRPHDELDAKLNLMDLTRELGTAGHEVVMQGMALAYRRHPDYRNEWKPRGWKEPLRIVGNSIGDFFTAEELMRARFIDGGENSGLA